MRAVRGGVAVGIDPAVTLARVRGFRALRSTGPPAGLIPRRGVTRRSPLRLVSCPERRSGRSALASTSSRRSTVSSTPSFCRPTGSPPRKRPAERADGHEPMAGRESGRPRGIESLWDEPTVASQRPARSRLSRGCPVQRGVERTCTIWVPHSPSTPYSGRGCAAEPARGSDAPSATRRAAQPGINWLRGHLLGIAPYTGPPAIASSTSCWKCSKLVRANQPQGSTRRGSTSSFSST